MHARALQKVLAEESELIKKELKDESVHDVDLVTEDLNRIADAMAEEAQELHEVSIAELQELRDEEHLERQAEEALRRFLSNAQQRFPELQQVYQRLQQARGEIQRGAQQVMQDMYALAAEKETFLRFKTGFSDESLVKYMRRLARKERREVRKEKSSEGDFEKQLDELMRAFQGGDSKKLSKLKTKVLADGILLVNNLVKQARQAAQVTHMVAVIYQHLLVRTQNISQKKFKELIDSGFPAPQLREVAQKRQALEAQIREFFRELYLLSKGEKRLAA